MRDRGGPPSGCAVRAVVVSGLSDARSSQNCSSETPPKPSSGHISASTSALLRQPTRSASPLPRRDFDTASPCRSVRTPSGGVDCPATSPGSASPGDAALPVDPGDCAASGDTARPGGAALPGGAARASDTACPGDTACRGGTARADDTACPGAVFTCTALAGGLPAFPSGRGTTFLIGGTGRLAASPGGPPRGCRCRSIGPRRPAGPGPAGPGTGSSGPGSSSSEPSISCSSCWPDRMLQNATPPMRATTTVTKPARGSISPSGTAGPHGRR